MTDGEEKYIWWGEAGRGNASILMKTRRAKVAGGETRRVGDILDDDKSLITSQAPMSTLVNTVMGSGQVPS